MSALVAPRRRDRPFGRGTGCAGVGDHAGGEAVETHNGDTRPADLRSAGSDQTPRCRPGARDVGNAIGDNGGSAPLRPANMARAATMSAGHGPRRTHLCQRPSITANAPRASSYVPSSLGCSGGSPSAKEASPDTGLYAIRDSIRARSARVRASSADSPSMLAFQRSNSARTSSPRIAQRSAASAWRCEASSWTSGALSWWLGKPIRP